MEEACTLYSQRHYVLPLYMRVCVCVCVCWPAFVVSIFIFYSPYFFRFDAWRANEIAFVRTHTHATIKSAHLCAYVYLYLSDTFCILILFPCSRCPNADHVAHVSSLFTQIYFSLFSISSVFSRWLAVSFRFRIFRCSCIAFKYIIRHGVDA